MLADRFQRLYYRIMASIVKAKRRRESRQASGRLVANDNPLTSSTIPAKRGREASPGPSSSTTPLFVEDLGGQDILMVAAKLPPLPELPIDVAHLPYITNDDHQCEANPTELVAGRRTQQRQELVGDSVAKVFVTHWVVEQHPDLKASSASKICGALLSNALFCRLALGYGMDEMLRAYGSLKSWSPSTSVHPPKSLANAYEAYLGLVFRDVMVKKRPLTDLQEYFSQLLTSEVFPDLEEQIQSFIAHQSEGQPHREYTNTKRQRQCKSSSGLRKSARIAKINASKVSNSNHTITAQIPDEVIAQRPEGIKQPTRVNTPEQLVSSAMAAGSGEEIATRSEEVQQVVQLNSPSQVSPPVLAGEPTDASPSLLPPLLAASTPVPSLPEPPSHGNEDDCREFIVRLGRAELEVLGYNTELVAVPRAWIVDALELLQE